jgi:hypothetical protein
LIDTASGPYAVITAPSAGIGDPPPWLMLAVARHLTALAFRAGQCGRVSSDTGAPVSTRGVAAP